MDIQTRSTLGQVLGLDTGRQGNLSYMAHVQQAMVAGQFGMLLDVLLVPDDFLRRQDTLSRSENESPIVVDDIGKGHNVLLPTARPPPSGAPRAGQESCPWG